MGACWVLLALVLGFAAGAVRASEPWSNGTQVYSTNAHSGGGNGAFVGLTLIQSAAARGAVCLDGSLPGYHLHRGSGSGSNNWLVNLEGGGWCSDVKSCVFRKSSRHGSSNHMEKQLQFTGILSNSPGENPDFYNWNRVKVRYCDGGSFTGDGADAASGLYFRGQRIWQAAMDDLMAQGMRSASQALLSGCSAGGASTILHCDEFRGLFPSNTRVKCLADAGMFLDATSVQRVLRITSGAEFEMKPRLDKLQVLAIICAASFEERETCRKLAEDKPAAEHLISNTTEPTWERSWPVAVTL